MAVYFYTYMHIWVSIITSFLKIVFKNSQWLTKRCTQEKMDGASQRRLQTEEALWGRGHLHLWAVLKHQLYSGIQNTFLRISSLQKFKTRLGFNIQLPLKLSHNVLISSWKKTLKPVKKGTNEGHSFVLGYIPSRIQHGTEILSAVTYFSPQMQHSLVLIQHISGLVWTARRALDYNFSSRHYNAK